MRLIKNILQDKNLPPCVATIGFFDGLHKGHRYLIDQVKAVAGRERKVSAVITFPVHPRKVLHSDYQPALLSTLNEKISNLEDTGVDECFLIPFTKELSLLSAHDFMQEVLKRQCNVSTLVIGYDHRFGHNRKEGFEDYVRFGKEIGIEVLQAQSFQVWDTAISSSACRTFLQEGKVEQAAGCLGYLYKLSGEVVSGYKVGRTLGFPTANLDVTDKDKLIPARGVYAVKVLLRGIPYKGMLNIGYRPTLNNGNESSIEVNILDFSGEIYKETLSVEFVGRIRDEIRFSSIEELVSQLQDDEKQARKLVQL